MAPRDRVDTPTLPAEDDVRRISPVDRIAIAALSVFALVVGAVRATRHSFWVDEAASGGFARRTPRGLLRVLWHEPGQGAYYIALWLWAHLGHSDWWLRMFSVVGASVAVALVFLIGLRVSGRSVAVVSSVGLLINVAFQAHWAEARQYSWMVALSALALLLVFRLRERPTWGWALFSLLVNATLLAMSPFTAPLVALQWLWMHQAWRDRTTRLMMAVWAAGSLLLFLPFLHALTTSPNADWIKALTVGSFRSGAAQAVGGAWWWWALLIGNVALAWALTTGRIARAGVARLWLLVCIAVTAAPFLAVVSIAKPSFVSRYLMWALAPTIIAATAGYVALTRSIATASRQRSLALAAASAGLLFAGALTFPYRTFGDFSRVQDLRGAARVLAEQAEPGDMYLFLPDWMGQYVEYYADGPYPNVVPSVDALDALPPGTRVWVVDDVSSGNSSDSAPPTHGAIGSSIRLDGTLVYELIIAEG